MVKNTEKAPRICVGAFSSVHGVKGELKLKSFTVDPEGLFSYSAIQNEAGEAVKLKRRGRVGELLVVAVEGVTGRDEAEKLKHSKLYAPIEALPEPEEGSFYIFSLIGMEVRDIHGVPLGAVAEIYNFGAGDVIAVKETNGEENLYAFTHQNFPEVNERERFVILDKPEEI